MLNVYRRAGQQRVRPMNSRRRSRLDPLLLSTSPSTGFLSSRVTPEPIAISAIQPPASFFLSDGESREHCRVHELDPSKTEDLPRGSRERGSGPNIQLRHRSRRQKRVYRHRFFSDSIGQNEYHGVDAYVSRLTQIKLATQHLIRFAETYIPLYPGPLNVQEGVPIAEEVVNMLLYADFIGRALQEQRYDCPNSWRGLCLPLVLTEKTKCHLRRPQNRPGARKLSCLVTKTPKSTPYESASERIQADAARSPLTSM